MQTQSFCGAETSKQQKPTQTGPFLEGKEVPRTGMGHTCHAKQFLFSFLNIFIYLAGPGLVAHGIFNCGRWVLVPQARIEPGHPTLGAQSPSH